MTTSTKRQTRQLQYELEPASSKARHTCVMCLSQVKKLTSYDLCPSCSKDLGPRGRRQMAKDWFQ